MPTPGRGVLLTCAVGSMEGSGYGRASDEVLAAVLSASVVPRDVAAATGRGFRLNRRAPAPAGRGRVGESVR
ncbi:hypothetical protein GCM10010271_62750 [Streptomyces kurssanovii]|nr:hypothetical protein GCM10010271_62750 [Streptomyces kurssanovii]